jgi:hypothetical protein
MKALITTFFLLVCITTSAVHAQITIAPTNLFIDNASKFGTYMVINNSNEPQEVSIDFYFGYAETSKDGKRTNLAEGDSLAEGYSFKDAYSITNNIRAFPKTFVLQPNQRQVVRIRVSAPNTLTDGTYWSRIETTSSPESPPIEVTSTDEVTANVGYIIKQVTSLYYKVGDVSTGIEINQIRTEVLKDSGKLDVLTDFSRTGNSPFLGSITASLMDQNGKTIAEGYNATTLYFNGTQKSQIDINNLPSGNYKVKVLFESHRSDISPQDIVQMQPVTATTTITIP